MWISDNTTLDVQDSRPTVPPVDRCPLFTISSRQVTQAAGIYVQSVDGRRRQQVIKTVSVTQTQHPRRHPCSDTSLQEPETSRLTVQVLRLS